MATCAVPELNDQVVYDYWQAKAAEGGVDPTITIRDHHFRELEIDTIVRFLKPTDVVLDVGCGNGYSTIRYAPYVREIVGVDFSPLMIDAARKRHAEEPRRVAERVEFRVGDARKLPLDDAGFTRVVMERCLINIPDRNQQVEAALEAGRVLRPGGLFLLAEVTLQGHTRVNHYRNMFGLDNLKVHWHNTYLDEPVFLDAVGAVFAVRDTIRFGMYGFLSKVVHALTVSPEEPSFDARINEVAGRIARAIPDFDGCSHQVLFVLEKK